MSTIYIKKEKCTGCQICLSSCPFGAISMGNEFPDIELERCTLCGACVEDCPEKAIMIEEHLRGTGTPNKESYSGIMVFGELTPENDLAPVVLELLDIGAKLAEDRQCKLTLAIVGNDIEKLVEKGIGYGADVVYLADDRIFEDPIEEIIADGLEYIALKFKPEIILGGATVFGRSVIPRLAVRLDTGLTADCTGLEIDPETGNLIQTRPAFGGNIMANIICKDYRPQMATVRHKVFKEAEFDNNRTGDVINIDISDIKPGRYGKKIIERVADLADELSINDADIIIAGGRGVGGPEGFTPIKKLAELLGGAVGASRAAVDSEWISFSHQVGQTGKTVAPKMYIACGISGAIQHKVGMQTSDFIVAINKDPSAPIFEIADIGIVGDLFEVVPALIRKLKKGE